MDICRKDERINGIARAVVLSYLFLFSSITPEKELSGSGVWERVPRALSQEAQV